MSSDLTNEQSSIIPGTPDRGGAFKSSKPEELPLSQQTDENSTGATPEDLILANPQWGGVAMLAAAASFDTVVPGAVMAANYTAFRNADLRGEGSLTDGSGTLANYFKEMFVATENDAEDKEGDDDGWDRYIEVAQERQERQREFQEWQDSVHHFAGQDWTGREWGQVATELKAGNAGHDWLVSYLMNKKNQTKEQAEQLANDMQLAASGLEKPEKYRT